MEVNHTHRHQLIEDLVKRYTENDADAFILLWEQLADEITSLIGENGFHELFERSEFLVQQAYPWLVITSSQTREPENRFSLLKTSLEEQTSAKWHEANLMLLISFTDILAMLIGEQLTLRILHSAWGIDPEGTFEMEFINEH